MNQECSNRTCRGFTLVEVLLASGLLALVTGGTVSIYLMVQRSWHATTLQMYIGTQANQALSRMINGVGPHLGLRAARSSQSTLSVSGQDWELMLVLPGAGGSDITNRYQYVAAARELRLLAHGAQQPAVIGRNVVASQAVKNGEEISLMVRVADTRGRFASTNEVSTAVRLRNP